MVWRFGFRVMVKVLLPNQGGIASKVPHGHKKLLVPCLLPCSVSPLVLQV